MKGGRLCEGREERNCVVRKKKKTRTVLTTTAEATAPPGQPLAEYIHATHLHLGLSREATAQAAGAGRDSGAARVACGRRARCRVAHAAWRARGSAGWAQRVGGVHAPPEHAECGGGRWSEGGRGCATPHTFFCSHKRFCFCQTTERRCENARPAMGSVPLSCSAKPASSCASACHTSYHDDKTVDLVSAR
jgi:hypothetical protein